MVEDDDLESAPGSVSEGTFYSKFVPLKLPSWKGRQTSALALCMLAVGLVCSVTFCISSVRASENDQYLRFEKQANKIARAVETTWAEYETVGMWIHQSMRHKSNFSTFAQDRQEFKVLTRYVEQNGVHPTAMGYMAKIYDSDRATLEAESKAYYQQVYPEYEYNGFSGMKHNNTSPSGFDLKPDDVQDFYFPMLLLQPFRGNEYYIDLDLYSSPTAELMLQALEEQQVLASTPYPSYDPRNGNNMMMLHPGVPEKNDPAFDFLPTNRGLAAVLLSFGPFMQRVAQKQEAPVSVYIYALSASKGYLVPFGGASWSAEGSEGTTITSKVMPNPPSWEEMQAKTSSSRVLHYDLELTQKPMKVVVIDDNGLYETNIWSACWGGFLMFLATLLLVVWLTTHVARGRRLVHMQQQAESEKAALICRNAQAMVQAERRRNEYLAHEVRNPLASAMVACSFLETNHQKHQKHKRATEESRKQDEQIAEDLHVISSSLAFINDLLRSLLDTSKIASKTLVLQPTPTDLLQDILEPVRTMINRQDNTYTVQVECNHDIVIPVDRMRLKQVILNLAGNARKFVQQGYIRLTATVLEPHGTIQLAVEDSGPGVPAHKRAQVFQRFQESLDELNQGTGMGLSLCHGLVELMGGCLYLDESYHSSLSDCPGARFVVDLPVKPMTATTVSSTTQSATQATTSPPSSEEFCSIMSDTEDIETGLQEQAPTDGSMLPSLPAHLRVLLVDDDTILRKMLSRSIKRVAPNWSIREAANGETALSIVQGDDDNNNDKIPKDSDHGAFDLIFVDQYMASVNKQLLGTETVQALRAQGVTARICGLSANDMGAPFRAAGADYFLIKPFSTNAEELCQDLIRVLGLKET